MCHIQQFLQQHQVKPLKATKPVPHLFPPAKAGLYPTATYRRPPNPSLCPQPHTLGILLTHRSQPTTPRRQKKVACFDQGAGTRCPELLGQPLQRACGEPR